MSVLCFCHCFHFTGVCSIFLLDVVCDCVCSVFQPCFFLHQCLLHIFAKCCLFARVSVICFPFIGVCFIFLLYAVTVPVHCFCYLFSLCKCLFHVSAICCLSPVSVQCFCHLFSLYRCLFHVFALCFCYSVCPGFCPVFCYLYLPNVFVMLFLFSSV